MYKLRQKFFLFKYVKIFNYRFRITSKCIYTRSKIVICACITIHIIYVIELNAIKFYFVINNKNKKRTTQLELDFI